ncbi:MAG: hypothetical protein RL150_593 [Candidatus Parcubacteria bacterium]|jgi:hypothetical protein
MRARRVLQHIFLCTVLLGLFFVNAPSTANAQNQNYAQEAQQIFGEANIPPSLRSALVDDYIQSRLNGLDKNASYNKAISGQEGAQGFFNALGRGLNPVNAFNDGAAAVETVKKSGLEKTVATVLKGLTTGISAIGVAITWVASLTLYIAGFFLDTAINISTYGLSSMVAEGGNVRASVDEAWKIFRDLVNIGFVFILLYVAINLILQTESGEAKKALKNVIIAALLVNFSFFFAAVIVDVSNQFALSVMKSIENVLGDRSVSSFILEKTDALKISKDSAGLVGNNESTYSGATDQLIQVSVGVVMTIAVVIILAIVMFIGAFMLIARTLIIVFLLILSPIGFVGKAFPMTKKMSQEWWDSLIGNAFSLPVFLLFLLIAFKLMGGSGGEGILDIVKTSSPSGIQVGFSAASAGVQSTIVKMVASAASPLVRYSIVIGLFLGALYAAKQMHSMGNKALAKLSGNITSKVGGAAIGTAAFAGRQFPGRVANWAADKDGFKEWAAKSRIGAFALQTTRGIGSASFDARNSKTFTGVASATGVGDKAFGAAGGKGGYASSIKSNREKITNFAAEAIGQVSDSNDIVKPNKADLDAKEATLQTLIDTNASKASIATAKKDVREAKEKYNKSKNVYIETYRDQLNRSGAGKLKWVQPARTAAGKTIAKELAKAERDVKYDIIKALKAAKGDKKEE